ncbi:MAG: hypothetical protein KAH26_03560 [Bacteroidales bacterium]|nr:hypothetical protein [Bacteroidales bacterium]
MKNKYGHIILAFTLALIFVFNACKKENDGEDPAPVQKSCEIVNPFDSSQVQIGEIISIEAVVSGFGQTVLLAFSIDSTQVFETGETPYEFSWDTDGWLPGTYMLRADAFEDPVIASDEITIILIDTIIPLQPPVPVINIIPEAGTTDTIFTFDASGSYDQEDSLTDLLFRWDYEGDGEWDTEFSNITALEHKYVHVGHYHVRLEAMDSDSMTADTVISLVVSHSVNPDPCEGIISIPYGGKVYHTVPVGNQCWLRENLDIGVMLNSADPQSNNQVIEKYCYNDDSTNCEKYGGLYMWNEMMNYIPLQGGKGICPVGWHVPGDDEWKELEGTVDTQFGVGDPEWDKSSFRGYDAGKHLKSLLGWASGGNGNNLYGFKALAAGYWESGFAFTGEGEETHFWSSMHDSGHNADSRALQYDKDGISRTYQWEEAAFSVRCIKD